MEMPARRTTFRTMAPSLSRGTNSDPRRLASMPVTASRATTASRTTPMKSAIVWGVAGGGAPWPPALVSIVLTVFPLTYHQSGMALLCPWEEIAASPSNSNPHLRPYECERDEIRKVASDCRSGPCGPRHYFCGYARLCVGLGSRTHRRLPCHPVGAVGAGAAQA